jgi:radical SAM superfamily enzyme YgiQ (UPF0313 family)
MRVRHPVLRSPEAIAAQVRQLGEITRAPVFLVGDLRDGGDEYASRVVQAIGETGVSNRIIFEFFDPPSDAFLQAIDRAIRRWGAELSPESDDEAIRALMGKGSFTNERMEAAIRTILSLRCEELDLFYMVGLPGQTYDGVLATIDSIESLFQRFDNRLSAFITPMGPFLDPGSSTFEQAEAKGYVVRARTLAEHQHLLEQKDWESILNYETRWMTRSEIVDATYAAAERLNAIKARYGRISTRDAAAVAKRLTAARSLRARMKSVEDVPPDLVGEIREFSEGTINDKAELFRPAALVHNFRFVGILKLLWRQLLGPPAVEPAGPPAVQPAPTR